LCSFSFEAGELQTSSVLVGPYRMHQPHPILSLHHHNHPQSSHARHSHTLLTPVFDDASAAGALRPQHQYSFGCVEVSEGLRLVPAVDGVVDTYTCLLHVKVCVCTRFSTL
jgi:hypothetical protein